MSHPINLFDGNQLVRDFLRETAVTLDRLDTYLIPVKAIALREDLWPLVPGSGLPTGLTVHGYPVIPLPAASPVRWGVIT